MPTNVNMWGNSDSTATYCGILHFVYQYTDLINYADFAKM
jgi:hypothetical protein